MGFKNTFFHSLYVFSTIEFVLTVGHRKTARLSIKMAIALLKNIMIAALLREHMLIVH